MLGNNPQFVTVLDQYRAEWSTYAQRVETKVQRLQTLKNGMELLLLTCAFLAYYLIDCMVQAISMW